MERYGYNGRIALVDLRTGTTELRVLDEDVYRIYGGGGLLGTYLLMTETVAGAGGDEGRQEPRRDAGS